MRRLTPMASSRRRTTWLSLPRRRAKPAPGSPWIGPPAIDRAGARPAPGLDPRRRPRSAAGFTLIEAALTTIIVGTGVLSMVAAQQAYHQKNDWAARTGEAMLLANELRELTLSLPLHDPISGASNFGPEPGEGMVAKPSGQSVLTYDDLDDFAGPVGNNGIGAGRTFNPPINALRQPIDDMDGWSQQIRVGNVLPEMINASGFQPMGSTPMMRVNVTVMYQAPSEDQPRAVTELSWVVTQ